MKRSESAMRIFVPRGSSDLKDGEELGHGGHEREAHGDDDDNAEHNDDGGIDEAAFELLDDLGGFLLRDGDALADLGELARLLTGDDEREHVIREELGKLGDGVAELVPGGDGADDLGDHALVGGGLDAVGLEHESLGEGDVALQAAGEAGEEGGAVVGVGLGAGDAVELFVDARDGLHTGALIGPDPSPDEGFFVGVGLDERLAGLARVDVGDFDFFEHGVGRIRGFKTETSDFTEVAGEDR
jgi:hypothetical protein